MATNPCSGPVRLSSYYAGAGKTPPGAIGHPYGVPTPIPTSGRIAFSNFFSAAYTISPNVTLVSAGGTVSFNVTSELSSEVLTYVIEPATYAISSNVTLVDASGTVLFNVSSLLINETLTYSIE